MQEQAVPAVAGLLVVLITLVAVAGSVAITIIPYWKIFGKAGFSGALSLLMFVPLANIIILYYLAFAEWPALRRRQGEMPDERVLR